MNLYILIPKKLKKHPGKMAAAIAHAMFKIKKRPYDKCIALELTRISLRISLLKDGVVILDAGKTVVKSGTITCIAGYAKELKGRLL